MATEPEPSLALMSRYSIFSDETCQTAHRYMLIGGISLSSRDVDEVRSRLDAVRRSARFPQDSLQWKHITAAKVADYKALVDVFVEMNSNHIVDFTVATFDQRAMKHREFNENDSEIGYQKFLGNVYLAIAKKYGWPEQLSCFHGRRVSRFHLRDINNILNGRAAKHRDDALYRPYRTLEYKNPSIELLLQLNDVLLGSVAYYWNAGMRRTKASAKGEVASYLNANCCAPSLGRRTPYNMHQFDIWEFRLG